MRICKMTVSVASALILALTAAFPALAAGWQHNGSGYWYERQDSSNPAGTWELVDGAWYLFDQNGYMLTGWQQSGGNWYYLEDNGAMAADATLTIDGVSYTFGSSGAMTGQTNPVPVMGHWEGCTFVNDWSNIRLTVPQGFINLDSTDLSRQSGDIKNADMLSMKNRDCAIMVLYSENKDGDDAGQLMSFLNMFHSGSRPMGDGGKMETVNAGNLPYLRCRFPQSEENPRTGDLYVRNMGSFYTLIITVSDSENAPVMDSILSTLTTAH